jgi:hypothetical protein
MRLSLFGAMLLAVLGMPQASKADDPVTLTAVTVGAAPGKVLTLDDLKAMGKTEIKTSTPWTEGEQTFVGVSGAQLVAALKAKGETVSAFANNDYNVIIPLAVFSDSTTLIAYEHNGKPMPVSDKGPMWIVFPYDQDTKFVSEAYKGYSIWGLLRVEFH